jgi:UDP-N-acetylmuramate--alanine ligase
MVGWLMQQAGLDSAVVNGAGVVGWGSSTRIGAVRAGNGPWFVIEADESDRSLLKFEPEHAIITNAAADHFNIEETHALFAQFRKLVRGVVIDGTDALSEAAKPAEAQLKGWQGHFVMDGINFEVPIPGLHNIVNAWQAVLLCRTLGVPLRVLSDGLKSFQGVERRLQRVGKCNGAIVFDDYGHNPAKLGAAWQTLAAGFSRVFAVWRPHGYGPLRKMMDDLVDTFTNVVRENDRLFILPVYDMGGSADRTVNSNQLVEKLVARGVPVSQVETLEDAYAELSALAAPECALVTFGARDPGLPRLAQKLSSDRIQI